MSPAYPLPPCQPCTLCMLQRSEPCDADTPVAWCRVLERLENLETLSLAANQLTSLPPAVFALQRLQTLDISNNCLAEVPPDIAGLKSLQVRHTFSMQYAACSCVLGSKLHQALQDALPSQSHAPWQPRCNLSYSQVLHLHGNRQLTVIPLVALRSLPALRSLCVDLELSDILRAGDTIGFLPEGLGSRQPARHRLSCASAGAAAKW